MKLLTMKKGDLILMKPIYECIDFPFYQTRNPFFLTQNHDRTVEPILPGEKIQKADKRSHCLVNRRITGDYDYLVWPVSFLPSHAKHQHFQGAGEAP